MPDEHIRHKPPSMLSQPRELVLVCPTFRSSVNLSRIVRLASCVAAQKLIASGNTRIDPKIARDGATEIEIQRCRALEPVLKKLRAQDYQIIGLEQTRDSASLFDFQFPRKTVLLIGHERQGIPDSQLGLVNQCVEIPVWGLPHSYNVVTATTMAVYEYCKQFPEG
ncbi:MAG: RNA methyltransferase [Planctomycetota bacterium]